MMNLLQKSALQIRQESIAKHFQKFQMQQNLNNLKNNLLYGHKNNSLNCGMMLGNMNTGAYRGGGACLTTTTYDHSGDTKVSTRDVSSVINVSNGQSSRFAIEIESGYSAIGTSVKKVSVNILRVGTLVGNCYIRIRDSSNNIKGEGAVDAVSLSTSATVVEFTLDNCVEIEVGDRVSFEYDGSAHPTNYIALGTSTPAWVSLIDQEAWNGTGWDLDPDGAGAGRKWMFTFDSDPTI